MDQKEIKAASPIFVSIGLIALVLFLLTFMDRCESNYHPKETKVDTIVLTKIDTVRILNVKYKPTPKKVIHDTMLMCRIDTTYITFEDSVVYDDTLKVKNGQVYLRELLHKNQIQSRELAVDCFNHDTILKIEKETIIKKNALVKIIPGIFAWGSHSSNLWGGGIQLHALLADRYLLGASYDIKNGGIYGSFGVKISIKKK